MVLLRQKEIKIIDDAFQMHGGYVLDFTDKTFAEFFDSEFNVDIEDTRYRDNGTSKAKRLRSFIAKNNNSIVSNVLRGLWKYKEEQQKRNCSYNFNPEPISTQPRSPLFGLIHQIEKGNSLPRIDMLEKFTPDETLEELISSIERDVMANKPQSALDRLHTYCMKKIAHLITEHGEGCTSDEPLNARMGKYIKILEKKHTLSDFSMLCLKSSISIFEKFNYVRNNRSLAHDNHLLSGSEARYIFDIISSLLRFIKTVETDKYGR